MPEDQAVTQATLNELMGTDSWFIGALGQRVISHEKMHESLKADHDLLHVIHQQDHGRMAVGGVERWRKHDEEHFQTRSSGEQRWGDHGAVHESDKSALNKALEQADKALLAALEAHRREHLIREEGQSRELLTHQTQHLALNELRQIVGDLQSQYARIGTLDSLSANWDRRWDERQKEEATYRTQVQVEEQNYRGQVRVDIGGLRESRSEGTGSRLEHRELRTSQHTSNTLAVAVFAAIIAAAGLVAFIEVATRTHP